MAQSINKTSSYRGNNIEALSKRLGSLQIIDKVLESTNEQTDTKMLTAPAPAQKNYRQAEMPKSMVPNPEWFDRDRMKFENWQKEI